MLLSYKLRSPGDQKISQPHSDTSLRLLTLRCTRFFIYQLCNATGCSLDGVDTARAGHFIHKLTEMMRELAFCSRVKSLFLNGRSLLKNGKKVQNTTKVGIGSANPIYPILIGIALASIQRTLHESAWPIILAFEGITAFLCWYMVLFTSRALEHLAWFKEHTVALVLAAPVLAMTPGSLIVSVVRQYIVPIPCSQDCPESFIDLVFFYSRQYGEEWIEFTPAMTAIWFVINGRHLIWRDSASHATSTDQDRSQVRPNLYSENGRLTSPDLETDRHTAAKGITQKETTVPEPAFLEKLPGVRVDEIVCIEAEQHYIRVYFSSVSKLVLYSFSEATAQLSEYDRDAGLQTHRSYWVSRQAVRQIVRSNRTAVLILNDGQRVPVSRSRLRGVLAFWHTIEPETHEISP